MKNLVISMLPQGLKRIEKILALERTEVLFHLLKAGGIITKDIINDIQELGHEIPKCLHQVSFLQEYIKDHSTIVPNTSIDINYVYQHIEPCGLLNPSFLYELS